MIINHNISALNAHRQLGANQGATQNSLEKLSSGLRINKAGDDAAGLAISEKMRGQIRGLEMAEKNAQDGISLIQTAEGALNETHAILQRMRELAVQSSNDTNTKSDRAELQKEVDQLAQALTDISDDTEFNTQKLLDGTFSGTFQVGANEGQNIKIEIGDMDATKLGVVGYTGAEQALTGITGVSVTNNTTKDIDISYTALDTVSGEAILETTAELNDAGDTITITLAQQADGTSTATTDDVVAALEKLGEINVVKADDYSDTALSAVGTGVTASAVDPANPNTAKGINISSQTSADVAITKIQSAIDTVSAERSKLGAVQNRLDHTINNLGTSAENITAAESRIRDVDMAKEMMEFTKNNILSQAAQSMLAQANQQPQGVLQLLQ
ncbi:flagellin [Oceanobacillus piezotolerans]|uniref:Flagellin n=1 Tax=Oceanobacillus piezotolerans TaxID=2448030 RepID=A0A498DHP0_9BACI|nr:flagellin [Oceanobacillus piezotolerans]RLL45015.1 flagellin [Oceanobacillus piezotolerans]